MKPASKVQIYEDLETITSSPLSPSQFRHMKQLVSLWLVIFFSDAICSLGGIIASALPTHQQQLFIRSHEFKIIPLKFMVPIFALKVGYNASFSFSLIWRITCFAVLSCNATRTLGGVTSISLVENPGASPVLWFSICILELYGWVIFAIGCQGTF